MSQKINIAIDGVAGAGKGTTSKLLAKHLNYKFLDTGAMYRAVALFLIDNNVEVETFDPDILKFISITFNENSQVCLNKEPVEHRIRNQKIDKYASDFSAIPEIRKFLVQEQQLIVKEKGYIAEGRDIGSVVMPDAELKIFLTADLEVRAKRRVKMMQEKGIMITIDEMKRIIAERDHNDSTRELDPLVKLPDAIEVDTSELTIEQQVDVIENLARKIIKNQ